MVSCAIGYTGKEAKVSDIDELLAKCPFETGDEVRVISTGEVGKIAYRYYNGFCLVAIPGRPVEGGVFSNNSTFRWKELEKADREVHTP